MKKLIIAVLIVLLLAIPVSALEYLSKDDLNVNVEGLKGSYAPGDKLSVKITITPKSEDIAKKMENRDWTFHNYLNEPRKLEVTFVARETYVPYTKSTAKESLTFKDYEISSGYGVDKIEINVSGYIPSIEGGVKTITFLEIDIQDGDTLKFNVTVVNPSKLEETLKDLENELKDLRDQISKLSKYVSVESLKEKADEISSNITLAREFYNDKDYEKVSEKIGWIEKAIKGLKGEIKRKWAEYYYDKSKNLLSEIDALILKAESYITVAESSGKNVVEYKLNLTQIKYEVNDLKGDFNDLEKLYDEGKFGDVIDRGKELVGKLENEKLKLGVLVNELEGVIKTKPSPTPTPTKALGFEFNLDAKTLTYVGIGLAVIVGGGIATVAISKWRQKRKWDELK